MEWWQCLLMYCALGVLFAVIDLLLFSWEDFFGYLSKRHGDEAARANMKWAMLGHLLSGAILGPVVYPVLWLRMLIQRVRGD